MRKSIKRQIATIFIILVGSILLISILINSWFLESFYVHNKQSSLIQLYTQMNYAVKEDGLMADSAMEKFGELVEVGNISFVVITGDNKTLLTATPNDLKTQELATQLSRGNWNRTALRRICPIYEGTGKKCNSDSGRSDG